MNAAADKNTVWSKIKVYERRFNPLKGQRCQLVTVCHPALTYIINFGHLGTLALSSERQSARMSEIKNVGYTGMALNTFKCNYISDTTAL